MIVVYGHVMQHLDKKRNFVLKKIILLLVVEIVGYVMGIILL